MFTISSWLIWRVSETLCSDGCLMCRTSCAEQGCVIDNPWIMRLIQASMRRFMRGIQAGGSDEWRRCRLMVHANGVGSGRCIRLMVQTDGGGAGTCLRLVVETKGVSSGRCLKMMVQTKGSDGKNNRQIADTRWRRATRRG